MLYFYVIVYYILGENYDDPKNCDFLLPVIGLTLIDGLGLLIFISEG